MVQQEESTRRKDEKVLEHRRVREELFHANISQYQGSARSRVGLQQQIYNQVPGDHHKRNQKWRNSKKKMYARVKAKISTFLERFGNLWERKDCDQLKDQLRKPVLL